MNSYTKINYVNGTAPPLSAENLNHMDDGIEAATQAIIEIEAQVANKANTADMDAALAGKANKSTTLAGYGIKDAIKNEDDAVTSDNIAPGAVTLGKIADGAIVPSNFAASAVNERAIATGAVSTKKIADGAITKQKLSDDLKNEIDGKANFADVNAALAGKAYKSTTLAGYGIKDAYTKTEVDTALKEKQNVQYLNDTVTDINDFIAYNQTNTVYTGRMQGFSKKFGELSDTVAKGFRMWFVLSGADNPTWYRIVLFDDGAVWTALRSGTTFTQKSYTKNQVDKLLDEKADTADVNTALNLKANFSDVQAALAGKANKSTTLSGYGITNSYSKTEVDNLLDGIDTTKTEILSGSISSAEQLNNYTDMEKTYLFYVVPPLASSLPVSVGTLCILNNYGNLIQTLRTARYVNKVFTREYNSSKGTWSGFTDITVPDNYITRVKLSADLSAEISGKYDSSNVESGQGELTYDESINLTDKIFRYQRVGKIATVTMKITAGEDIAANALTLSGLPYINKATGIYLKILSTKNNDIAVQIPYNTGQIKVMSALVPGEALVFTFSYQISY